MRVYWTLLFLINFQNISFCQKNCIRVIDNHNNAVQYVSGTFKKDNSFYVSDSNGLFCERFVSKIKNGDTVLFTAIGFKKRQLIYSGNDSVVLIKELPILPEVVLVKGEGKNEVWGTKKNQPLVTGYCRLGFVENVVQALGRIVYSEENFKKAEIVAVSFYNAKDHSINIPVRLRIYNIGKDSLPVKDYLTENMVIDTKEKGWITFNLKDKGLLMPKEGLVFCLEMFANSEDLYQVEKIRTGKKKFVERKVYAYSFGMEKGGSLTVMKFNQWTPWQVFRTGNHPCGDVVCRVKVKVWR